METTISLEERLSAKKLESYIHVFNFAFKDMMANVGYTRAALYVRGDDKIYSFTFFGDGTQIQSYEEGVRQPEILLDIKGDDLTSLLGKYHSKLGDIMEKPDDIIREFAPEISRFTIIVNRKPLLRSLYLIGNLIIYALGKYGVDLKLMANRPSIKYQKIDENYG